MNTCVSNASAVHNFTMGGMLGGIHSQDKDQRHQTRLAQEALPSHVVEVECNTLSSIFDQHQLRVVDFLSVDVEGMDLQVLQGINFERVHINVLSVECLYKDTEVPELDNFLYSRGFRRVLRLSFDCVYANEVLRFSWAAADDSTSHQGHQGHQRQRPSIAVPLDLASEPYMLMIDADDTAKEAGDRFWTQHRRQDEQERTALTAVVQTAVEQWQALEESCGNGGTGGRDAAVGSCTAKSGSAEAELPPQLFGPGLVRDGRGVVQYSRFSFNKRYYCDRWWEGAGSGRQTGLCEM